MIKLLFQCMVIFSLLSCDKQLFKNVATPVKTALQQQGATDTTIVFHGIYANSAANAPFQNPERGFRGEVMVNAKTLKGVFNGIDYSADFGGKVLEYLKTQRADHTLGDSINMMQFYIYLEDEATIPLSTATLQHIQYLFDELKRVRIKAVLRFSYDGGAYSNLMYTVSSIQQHLNQLKPILQNNVGTIGVMQAGFVGAWGEWGPSYYSHASYPDGTSVILKSILNALPGSRYLQVRYTLLKNNALSGSVASLPFTMDDYKRVGFHNDFFTGGLAVPASDYPPGSAVYQQVENENKSGLWMDGEMPYYSDGTGTYDFNKIIDPMTVLKIFAAHRYTTFSVCHHNMDGGTKSNVYHWRNTTLGLSDVTGAATGIPVDSAYFMNIGGTQASRTYFEYFRDHLGYRLQLKTFTYPRSLHRDSTLNISFSITNTGFSNMINSRPVYVTLTDTLGNVRSYPLAVDAKSWDVSTVTAAYVIIKSIDLNHAVPVGNYKIGLWLPDAAGYDASFAVKLANQEINHWKDAQGKYLVNEIGNITIK